MALSVATQTQADRLRADTGTNTTSLPDASVDAIWTEAGESYTDASSLSAYARIIVFRRMLAGVIPINDYRQNESEEKQGAMFAKVKETLALWEGVLATAIAGTGSAARFGRTQYRPTRIKEYPGL